MIVLRLSGPPRFGVSRSGAKLLIDLPGTSVQRSNDARPLDTSFFPGPIASVTPRRSASGITVEVALKPNALDVPHRQRVDGDTLTLEFDR